ncbi:Hypothetical predicted protein, partial [Olea europaea subsp. europaea]
VPRVRPRCRRSDNTPQHNLKYKPPKCEETRHHTAEECRGPPKGYYPRRPLVPKCKETRHLMAEECKGPPKGYYPRRPLVPK